MDVSSINCFKDLDPQQQARLHHASTNMKVKGGDVLIKEGEPSDSMYFVVSGRFSISIATKKRPLAEIGSGQTLGEIGFLSGQPRTATAIAVRDSIVLRLDRTDFDLLCESFPQMLKDVSASLAKKLAAATNAYRGQEHIPPKTIAICPAGGSQLNNQFGELLRQALSSLGQCVVLTEAKVKQSLGQMKLDDEAVIRWLDQQEKQDGFVIYISDHYSSEWSALSFRQCDQVLLVADGDCTLPEAKQKNDAERLLHEISPTLEPWLIVYHRTNGQLQGTGNWLERRKISMLHHIAVDQPATVERLVRFISGRALGLVASGGGAYCAAHIGVFRALQEAGFSFDIVGGSSGGAAMVCAWSAGVSFDVLETGIHNMMVSSGALKRYTLPKYSLVDHVYFDECLKKNYGNINIEDCWINYFAVSTNLSNGDLKVHQNGSLWRAIRASASIPGLLPPVITDQGELLVDGGIIDNVPLDTMKSLKYGPNLIVCFEPKHQSHASVNYENLPGRRQLLLQTVGKKPTKSTAEMPKIGSVLTQCMLLNNSSASEASEQDIVIKLSLPKDIKLNDWHRHAEISEMGYQLGRQWLQTQRDNPVLQEFRVQ